MATVGNNEEGIMDIGKHCVICRQLDFLPFTCPSCHESYCNTHRLEFNSHTCILDLQKRKLSKLENQKIDIKMLPPSQSAFPDLQKIRKEAEMKYKLDNDKKLGHKLSKETDSKGNQLTTMEVAFQRLRKLLDNAPKSMKKANSASSSTFGMGIFGSSKSKNSNTSKMVEISKLKHSAKGDSRIPMNDRVYVWVSHSADDNTSFIERAPQFHSKRWPIGKMLDTSAELSKIKNLNNLNVEDSLKLAMFKKNKSAENTASDFIYIPTNGRVEKEIKDGDEIFILRGHK